MHTHIKRALFLAPMKIEALLTGEKMKREVKRIKLLTNV